MRKAQKTKKKGDCMRFSLIFFIFFDGLLFFTPLWSVPQEVELFDKIYAAVVGGLEDKVIKTEVKITDEEKKKKEILGKLEKQRDAAKNKEKVAAQKSIYLPFPFLFHL